MKLSSIRPNPANPRIIRDDKFSKLKASLEQFPKMMAIRPIVVDDSGRVLDGRTWNEIPRLPGGRTHIENNYLWKIEAEAREAGVETNY